MSLLLTDNTSPVSSDIMMLGFLVDRRGEGGMEKLIIVAISLILLIFYRWTGFVYMNDVDAWHFLF